MQFFCNSLSTIDSYEESFESGYIEKIKGGNMVNHFYEVALAQLSKDMSCDISDLKKETTTIVNFKELPVRRRFQLPSFPFFIASFGNGVVISTDEKFFSWSKENLSTLSKADLFHAITLNKINEQLYPVNQFLYGPEIKYLYNNHLEKKEIPQTTQGVQFELFNESDIKKLYGLKYFKNALLFETENNRGRKDILAVCAIKNNVVLGVAGASADSDIFYQIGVDVIEEYRNQGVAKNLVSYLTDEIIKMKKIPYYSTMPYNLISQRTAVSCGYYPAWVEMYVFV